MRIDILEVNAEIARKTRSKLDHFGVTALNIMGAIGSGKTLLMEKTIEQLGKEYRRCYCRGCCGKDRRRPL